MSRPSSVHRLLGLARRAGAVVPGTAGVRDSVRAGEAKLVLLARDASATQLDKVRKALESRAVPSASLGDRTDLGAAVGLGPISALAVTSETLAERIAAELAEPAAAHTSTAVAAAQE